ncbi:signal peptidase II [Undibacterium sp. RuRC25W]|uniref:signal peptidase II n=1 Tax=Undibacterium sp. RuRC25W TaxID=3413047 RepID=UPI003BF02635
MATKKRSNFSAGSRSSSSSGSSGSSLIPWLGLAAIVILLDQVSKITITKLFSYAESMSVTSFFNLVLVYNKGAAFSFLATESGWQRYVFTALGLVAAAYITYLLSRHASQKLFCWALSLIMGGALGNVIDRLMYGHVIDFLDFHYQDIYHFPAFNLADSAICLGAALFILDELRRVKK